MERPPITFGASVLVLRPSTLILIAISKVQYLGLGGALIMSKVFVTIVSALRMFSNETVSVLQWGRAFTVILATFFEVFSATTDKSTTKRETFLWAEIWPKSLL